MPIISGTQAFGADNWKSQRVSAMDEAGVNVVGAKSAEDALREAGLWGWNVQKVPMWADLTGYESSPHRAYKDPETFKTVGTIGGEVRPLGTVGKQYQVVQNEQHAAFLDEVVGQSGGHYKQVVSFKGGRLVYVAIELPEAVKVHGADPVNMLLYGINSHDGSTNFILKLSPERLACANQMSYFRVDAVKLRHSGEVMNKVVKAQEALGITFDLMSKFEAHANVLADKPMTDGEYSSIIEGLHPMPEAYGLATTDGRRATNKYNRIREGLAGALTSRANATISETAWGGLNAYIEWAEWMAGSEKGRSERVMTSRDLEDKITKARNAFTKFALAA